MYLLLAPFWSIRFSLTIYRPLHSDHPAQAFSFQWPTDICTRRLQRRWWTWHTNWARPFSIRFERMIRHHQHYTGWSVELVRAFKSISKSCMGLDKGTPPPPWSVKHGLDPGKSFNDVLLVQNAVYALLDHYFGHAANYPHYVRSVQESLQLSYIGNLLSFKNHPSRKGMRLRLHHEQDSLTKWTFVFLLLSMCCSQWA